MARKKTVLEEPVVPVEESAALESAEASENPVSRTETVPLEAAAVQAAAPEQENPAGDAAAEEADNEDSPDISDEPQSTPEPSDAALSPAAEPAPAESAPVSEQPKEVETVLSIPPAEPDGDFPSILEDVPAAAGPEASEPAAESVSVQEADEPDTNDPVTEKGKVPEPPRSASFFDLNYNVLDRNLSPEERQEWNSIYASYRSRSILTGAIIGVDEHTFAIRNRDTGITERKTVQCAIVISYRVKVLIPETDLWFSPAEARPGFVLRNMVGATVDYVILQVDREGGVAIGSRRMAMGARRYQLSRLTGLHRPDALTKCRLLSVGPRRCLAECHGYDIGLTQREMRYTAIPDMRTEYHPGQELDCRIKHYDPEKGELWISVKEVHPHPFEGAQLRHPIGSRRQAVIAGKYAGGVFCNLPDGTVCMSLYSARHDDADFKVGDNVIIVIRQYDNAKKQIYGKIVSKW